MALQILIESLQTHDDCVAVLEGPVDKSSDSELIGVIRDSWILKPNHVSVTCDWSKGVKGDSKTEIMAGFCEDVEGSSLTPVAPEPSYSYEKLVTWTAMLALIADEVGCEILEFWYAILDIWWSSKRRRERDWWWSRRQGWPDDAAPAWRRQRKRERGEKKRECGEEERREK
ncbi:hypothetical protein ACLB2K_035504 [Fragaria x ananassa]